MAHYLAISIGPVQDFIATARRTRDLWYGSWLLSELSKAAARAVGDIDALVFPAPTDNNDLDPGTPFNVANKLVAVVDENPALVAARIKDALRARREQLCKEAYGHVHGDFVKQRAEDQLSDLVEFFWASAPIRDEVGESAYAEARGFAEALLAARKTTRDFGPVTWGANVPKSSLDGLRETVIPEQAYKLGEKELYRRYGVRGGEQLCGIGLLKRRGNRGGDDSFFSTSHVAALPFLARLSNAQVPLVKGKRGLVSRLVELGAEAGELGKVPGTPNPAFGTYDGRLLFEDRLKELFPVESDDQQAKKVQTDKAERAQAALRDFFRALESAFGGNGAVKPNPYYALLLADGDRMGKAIDSQTTRKRHRELSRALSEFAACVSDIVEGTYGGKLVYAGGDDVLAFLPLHSVLTCTCELADKFKAQLGGFPAEDGVPPTLSAGIAIAHHLDSLADSLELARAAEKSAKRVPGKNALAVSVNKRGGAPVIVAGAWGELDARLAVFAELHRNDALSDRAAFDLRDLARRLTTAPDDPDRATLEKAMRDEAVRILRRKREGHGTRPIAKEVLEDLEKRIRDPGTQVDRLADELVVARLLAAASLVATPLTKDEKS